MNKYIIFRLLLLAMRQNFCFYKRVDFACWRELTRMMWRPNFNARAPWLNRVDMKITTVMHASRYHREWNAHYSDWAGRDARRAIAPDIIKAIYSRCVLIFGREASWPLMAPSWRWHMASRLWWSRWPGYFKYSHRRIKELAFMSSFGGDDNAHLRVMIDEHDVIVDRRAKADHRF